MTTLSPYLSVHSAEAAIDFYRKAFGAKETGPRLTAPDGDIVHTELEIGGSTFMLAEESEEFGNPSPETLGATTVRLSLRVDDVDALVQKAVEAGAELVIPVTDQFYGHRSGRIQDPFGHLWIVSQVIEELSQEEMQRRMEEMTGNS